MKHIGYVVEQIVCNRTIIHLAETAREDAIDCIDAFDDMVGDEKDISFDQLARLGTVSRKKLFLEE